MESAQEKQPSRPRRLRGLACILLGALAAVVIGIVLVQLIQPGAGLDDTFAYVSESMLDRREASIAATVLEVAAGIDLHGRLSDNGLFARSTDYYIITRPARRAQRPLIEAVPCPLNLKVARSVPPPTP